MSKLTDLREELMAAQALMEPQIEGLRDYERLNLKPSTMSEVQATAVDFQRRLELIRAVMAALDALAGDAFPAMPARQISAESYDDLAANRETIGAAFNVFEPRDEVTTGTITPIDE